VEIEAGFSMLDYGGADGKFLPDLPGAKYVFDISNISPADGILRIKEETELSSYSYVQVAHVLEHVSYPLALIKKAASFLKRSGYLYVEVPQELSDELITRLVEGDRTIRLEIHEHINRYSQKSVRELLVTAGFPAALVEAEILDFGWAKGTIVRALGRKN